MASLTLCPVSPFAAQVEDFEPSPVAPATTPPVSVDLAAGLVLHSWKPGLSSNLVGFETEGLHAWWVEAALRVGGLPVLSVRADRPFESSPQQEEMLGAAQHDETGFEEFVGFLDLLPITSRFMKEQKGVAGVVRALFSTRIIYTRNLFFGSATSDVDFAYLPQDAYVDGDYIYGYVDFAAGEPLNFKTEFTDLHVMVPVVRHLTERGKYNVLRLGYFHSRWDKPAESVFISLEGDPVVQDTRLDTQGLSGSFESSLFDPGFGWRGDFDFGILGSDLTSAIDTEELLRDDEGLVYFSIAGEARVNLRLAPGSSTFWATLGARGQWRFWNVWRAERDASGEVIESGPTRRVDRDRLFQIFAMIRVRI